MNVPVIPPPQVPKSRKALSSKTTNLLTTSQADALQRLSQLAGVFRHVGDVRCGGVAPRTKPLILGGTGCGKTKVVREFAKIQGWDFLTIDSSSWCVLGSQKQGTLTMLRDYVRKHDGGVLLLDELDKLLPAGSEALSTGWTTSVFGEALACLDQDERLFGHGWNADDLAKFKSQFFVCGAGAFEFYLREARLKAHGGSLGFGGPEKKPLDFGQFLADSMAIPDEITSRFAGPPIFISSPTQADFEKAIQQIHGDLEVPVGRPISEIALEAENSLGGFRFIENYLTRLLVQNPGIKCHQVEDGTSESTAKPRSPEKTVEFDFFSIDTTHHVRLLNDDTFALTSSLSKLISAISIAIEGGMITSAPTNALWLFLTKEDSAVDLAFNALRALKLCADVSADLSDHEPLYEMARHLITGIRYYSPELSKAGLLTHWQDCWDLINRVNQRQIRLSTCVAHGRYRA